MRALSSELLGPVAATLLVVLLVALVTPRFLDAQKLENLALQVAIVAIVAISSTIVIIAGGIDLSPGSMIARLTMVFAVSVKLAGVPVVLGAALTLLLGALLGALNGALTACLRIPSLITTLAALSAYRGVAFSFNNGSPVFQVHPWLEPIFYASVAGVPLPLIDVVVLFAAAW